MNEVEALLEYIKGLEVRVNALEKRVLDLYNRELKQAKKYEKYFCEMAARYAKNPTIDT